MDDIFVYVVNLPPKIAEMVTPCDGGYTIYIDEKLSQHGRLEAYKHALGHICKSDFGKKDDVNSIETKNHPSCW